MRGIDRSMRQQIKMNKLKDAEVRRKYQMIMGVMYEAVTGNRYCIDCYFHVTKLSYRQPSVKV